MSPWQASICDRFQPNLARPVFGAAPIPLAMELATSSADGRAVDVYQQRQRMLGVVAGVAVEYVQFQTLDITERTHYCRRPRCVRISVSHRVDALETAAVIPMSLGEIDIALLSPHEDALESIADWQP